MGANMRFRICKAFEDTNLKKQRELHFTNKILFTNYLIKKPQISAKSVSYVFSTNSSRNVQFSTVFNKFSQSQIIRYLC